MTDSRLPPHEAGPLPSTEAALVLAPHPDDEVFGCGGAIAAYLASGASVRVIVLTDGAGRAPEGHSSGTRDRREEESRQAAAILGYGAPEFWRLRDGGLIYDEALVQRILESIRAHGAGVVFAPSPQEAHPDHLATSAAAAEAMRRHGEGHLLFYEVGIPLTHPNLLLDISAVYGTKAKAMACFRSELAHQAYDEHITALNRFRTYTLPGHASYAEAFLANQADTLSRHLGQWYKGEWRHSAVGGEKENQPLVSILIRSMGRASLDDALASIALQTYPNIEVVVVNARGKEHPAPPEKCGGFPLLFIDSPQALRRSLAANRALERAKGTYLNFLDDDDWLEPDHVAVLRQTLADTPGMVAAYSSVACVDEHLAPLNKIYDHPWDSTLLRAGNFLPIHSVLFSRRAIEEGCRFDEAFDVLEDWDFWLQLASLGDFTHVSRTTAIYRIHGASGWGVSFDDEAAQRATAAVLRKWQTRWSDQDLVRFANRFKILDSDRAELQQACDTLGAKLSHWENEALKRGEWATMLEADRNRVEAEFTALGTELEKETARLASEIARIDEERRKWETTALERGEWGQSLQEEVERQKGEVSRNVEIWRGKDRELAARQQAWEDLNRLAMKLADHNEELARALLASEGNLNALKSSTSWKLTEPLRYLVHVLRHLRPIVTIRLRRLWRALPLSHEHKALIRDTLFRYLSPVFQSTTAWQAWHAKEEAWQAMLATRLAFRGDNPACAILLPVHTFSTLVPALIDLAKANDKTTFELAIAIPHGAGNMADYLKRQVEGAKLVYIPAEASLGQAYAAALGATSAERVLFLPPGCSPVGEALAELLSPRADSEAVCGIVLNEQGATLEAGCEINNAGDVAHIGHGMDPSHPLPSHYRECHFGQVMAIDRSQLHSVGGIDAGLDGHALADLGLKLAAAGKVVGCQPFAHFMLREDAGFKQSADKNRFTSLWGGRIPALRVRRPILVLDLLTPTPDQDSGSVDAWFHLKILRELGFQPTFIPTVNFDHTGKYTEDLQRLGVECLYQPWTGSVEAHLQQTGRRYEFVMITRVPTAVTYLDIVLRLCPSAKVLFNTVDLHFLRERRQAELTGSEEGRLAAEAIREQEFSVMRASDATIIISHAEQEILHQEIPEAFTFHLPLIMEISDRAGTPFAARKDLFFIGGFRHLPNIDAVRHFVADIWPLVRAKLPGVRLHIVGSHAPEEVLALACEDVVVAGFVADVSGYFNGCRLSVAPLRFGAGLKGKVGRSLAYGLPVVASPIASEGSGLVDGTHILIANSNQAFADAILRLYNDEMLWNQLAGNCLAFYEAHYSFAAGKELLSRLVATLDSGRQGKVSRQAITDGEGFRAYRQGMEREYARRHAVETALAGTREVFTVAGHCAVCHEDTDLHCDYAYALADASGHPRVNWRERLVCPHCALNNRMRAAIHLFRDLCAPEEEDKLYLTEQTTPLFAWFHEHFRHVVGSEYLGDAVPLGEADERGLRNEDVTRLTFGTGTIDHVLSFDVLEHVPDYGAALEEIRRVLKPGGWFFFTVPFAFDRDEHIVRARPDGKGGVEHLLPPEYHGNPIDNAGCLCYYHFGWTLLDELRALGFTEVSAQLFWSRQFGYLGGEQMLLVARRGSASAMEASKP